MLFRERARRGPGVLRPNRWRPLQREPYRYFISVDNGLDLLGRSVVVADVGYKDQILPRYQFHKNPLFAPH